MRSKKVNFETCDQPGGYSDQAYGYGGPPPRRDLICELYRGLTNKQGRVISFWKVIRDMNKINSQVYPENRVKCKLQEIGRFVNTRIKLKMISIGIGIRCVIRLISKKRF